MLTSLDRTVDSGAEGETHEYNALAFPTLFYGHSRV